MNKWLVEVELMTGINVLNYSNSSLCIY